MIEGQEGVTWPQWLALAAACEKHGIPMLFRSDHYMNLDGQHPERGSLDALGTMIALGAVTSTLRLGTLVSPATFRHPSVLAKLAATADQVSGGRFELGLGAGWHEREHRAYGFPFHDGLTRHEIFAEQVEIVRGSWGSEPFSFTGKHYRLEQLEAQPKPVQQPHLPLIIGGRAGPKASALAARFADEYNTGWSTPEQIRKRKARVDAACDAIGREHLRFSMMAPTVVGADAKDLRARVRESALFRGMDADALLREPPSGWLVGTVEQLAERIRALEEAGLQRIMCQQLPHTDLESVELIGQALAPLVA